LRFDGYRVRRNLPSHGTEGKAILDVATFAGWNPACRILVMRQQ
jgi:hypothetical protein